MLETPTKSKVCRVFVVDDHPIIQIGVRNVLDDVEDIECCGSAASIEEARDEIEALDPDILILDINLGGVSSIEFMKEITASPYNRKVLVHSMHEESLYAERCLRAGAAGYLEKCEATTRIIDAIRAVKDGRIFLSAPMTDLIFRRTMGQSREEETDILALLSDREFSVFELIGRGYTIREIAAELDLSRKTIETYREHIRTKLHLPTSNQLFREAVLWVNGQR